MKEGRFIRPGERNAIVISRYVSEELGLNVGDTIVVPLGGTNEFDETACARVDTRESYVLRVVGVINSSYEINAVMDLGFLIEALKKNAGERTSILPFYNRLFIKTKSEDLFDKVTSRIKSDYPDAAIIIRGNILQKSK